MGIKWEIPDISSLLSEKEALYKMKIPDDPWRDRESPYELMQKHNRLLEDQIKPLGELADSAKRQADSAEAIAGASKIQADLAIKQSQKADIKSWIAIIISVCALAVEFMAYHKEIFSFIGSLFS